MVAAAAPKKVTAIAAASLALEGVHTGLRKVAGGDEKADAVVSNENAARAGRPKQLNFSLTLCAD